MNDTYPESFALARRCRCSSRCSLFSFARRRDRRRRAEAPVARRCGATRRGADGERAERATARSGGTGTRQPNTVGAAAAGRLRTRTGRATRSTAPVSGSVFRSAPGQKPFLDPDGQIIGPVKLWDFRGQVSAVRLRSLRDAARPRGDGPASGPRRADVRRSPSSLRRPRRSVYVRTLRSDATVQARIADSTLAASLLEHRARPAHRRRRHRARRDPGGVAARGLARSAHRRAERSQPRASRSSPRAQHFARRAGRAHRFAGLAAVRRRDDGAGRDRYRVEGTSGSQGGRCAARCCAATTRRDSTRPGFRGSVSLATTARTASSRIICSTRTPTASSSPFRSSRAGVATPQEQEQEAVARDIEVRRRDLRQQISLDVRGALLDIASAREQVDAARDRQRLAEQEVAQAQERFRAGVASNADVVTASVTLNAARTGLIDALTSYQAARVSLARAEGNVSKLR